VSVDCKAGEQRVWRGLASSGRTAWSHWSRMDEFLERRGVEAIARATSDEREGRRELCGQEKKVKRPRRTNGRTGERCQKGEAGKTHTQKPKRSHP
jgi:hypothetical protein